MFLLLVHFHIFFHNIYSIAIYRCDNLERHKTTCLTSRTMILYISHIEQIEDGS
jgi:hypothetical protein